jgi:hypothetical protein
MATRTAVPCTLLIRMRSQVQVLAGPPPIVAGQSAAGSEPVALAAGLGRAGAARPSPPARPVAPPGPPTRPSGSATTTHRGRAPSPRTAATRRVPPPRAAACSRAHRAAAHEGRSDRRPGLPGRSAGKRGRPGPHPPGGPGPPPTSHRPTRRRQRRPRPGLRDRRRAVDGPAATGASTRPVVTVARPARPGPQRHRLSMGGYGRVRTDGQTPDGWTPHGWTADGWTLDGWTQPADRRTLRTTTPGDRTPDGWTAGSRTPNPDGWTPHAGHRRPTPWLPAGSVDHGDDARPLYTGWTLLRADAVRVSNNQDRSAARTPRAPTLLRTGLATAATFSCRWYAAVQLAPRRTALLGRLRVERKANGEASSIMQGSTVQRRRKQRFGTESGSWCGAPLAGQNVCFCLRVAVCRFTACAQMQHKARQPRLDLQGRCWPPARTPTPRSGCCWRSSATTGSPARTATTKA